MMLEDRLLVFRLRQGDGEILRSIYQKYKDDILSVAASLLNDPDEANDILGYVFASFAKNLKNFRLYGSLKNYLITCVVNQARNRVHSEMYKVLGMDSPGPMSLQSQPPKQSLSNSRDSQVLADALAKLALPQREVIVMHLQGRMKFSEIADFQNISANTAQGRYRYGLDKLLSILNSEVIE